MLYRYLKFLFFILAVLLCIQVIGGCFKAEMMDGGLDPTDDDDDGYSSSASSSRSDILNWQQETYHSLREDLISNSIAPYTNLYPFEPVLTAGRWSDLSNRNFFLQLQNNYIYQQYLVNWEFQDAAKYLKILIKNTNSLAVPGADILLLDDLDTVVWRTKTDNSGAAWLLSSSVWSGNPVNIVTSYQDVVQTNSAINLYGGTYQYFLPVEPDPVTEIDLMFCIDSTGSMEEYFEELKLSLLNALQRINLHKSGYSIRVSVNYYRDTGMAYSVRSHPFTSSMVETESILRIEETGPGGDWPEALDLAITDGLEGHSWRTNGCYGLMFIIGDAPPHRSVDSINKLHQDLKKAAAMGIRIIPVAGIETVTEAEFFLRPLAMLTGGTYLFIERPQSSGSSSSSTASSSSISSGTSTSGASSTSSAASTDTIGTYFPENLNDCIVRVIDDYTK